ncbi:MAPEG family protein [Pseudoalteromonas luteoviolacea]|uniref:MAPEG family protein n=1 Tax=Pseudoalteromonas luteoviolacea TaxID=43657 RepID=UPI001F2885CF|nr:MAPEG family protein [Pseudoalteromonas luteoviolacea]MCF6442317.1 MAPEG family protein [Pseudoalteromonas luteoviolacea]
MFSGLFAAICTLLYIKLSFNVIKLRKSHKVGIGDAGHKDLQANIRAHANFIEYTPLAVILIFILEYQLIGNSILIPIACLFLAGRLLHAKALYDANLKMRVIGMGCTFLSLIVMALINAYLYFL